MPFPCVWRFTILALVYSCSAILLGLSPACDFDLNDTARVIPQCATFFWTVYIFRLELRSYDLRADLPFVLTLTTQLVDRLLSLSFAAADQFTIWFT